MIRSMTAFVRLAAPARHGNWVIEIRSLNHRFFEFSLKLPPALNLLEGRIRDMVQESMRRGKITVAISQDNHDDRVKSLTIDEDVVQLYFSAVGKIKKRFKLAGEITVADVLKLPGVFTNEESQVDPEKSWPSLKKVLKQALDQATHAKHEEGGKLAKDIHERLKKISEAVDSIEELASGQAERTFKRISERLDMLISEKEKDPARFEREVAFLAERSDITEEIVRIKSHLELFHKRLKGDAEIGRELDFLCQEMNREINTMGSKSQLFDISTKVVFVKGELEKIREQIQNIE